MAKSYRELVCAIYPKCSNANEDDNKNCDGCQYSLSRLLKKKPMEQVNHPAHYNSGKLECIDVMLDVFGAHETIAFCKLNAFKYLFRAGKKFENSERQDLEKAEWYIKKAVELMNI